jgi:hypothetical protein
MQPANATDSQISRNPAKYRRKDNKMTSFTQHIDQRTVDYYIRKAHAERADAFASIFSAAGRQIKGLFSSPDDSLGCDGCASKA